MDVCGLAGRQPCQIESRLDHAGGSSRFQPVPRFIEIGRARQPAGQIASEHQLRVRMPLLCRLPKPMLCERTILRNLMPAVAERAEREHGADMALLSRLLEQTQRGPMIARAA